MMDTVEIVKPGKKLTGVFKCGMCDCEFITPIKDCVLVAELYSGDNMYSSVVETYCPCCGMKVSTSDIKKEVEE